MKKVYVTPNMICEDFSANEYISACGDSGTVYKFYCNAGSKSSSYHVYLNGPDGLPYTDDDIDWSGRSGRLKTYSPCYEPGSQQGYHEAASDSGFENGYMYEYRQGENYGAPIKVIVWTDNGTNTHCTTNLDMNSWETAKS